MGKLAEPESELADAAASARWVEAAAPAAGPARISRLDPDGVRGLQRAIGNKATGQVLAAAARSRVLARAVCQETGTCKDDKCTCTDKTQYDQMTIDFIKSIRYELHDYANFRERLAVAGCIADEYNTQRGARGALDATQDAVIGSLPSSAIAFDRWLNSDSKALNSTKNDLGPGNINLGTAIEYVEKGWVKLDGIDSKDIDYAKLVQYLLSNKGTVIMAAAVVRRAHTLFDSYTLTTLSTSYLDAVSVEYYKQGDKYYNRFKEGLAKDADHTPCPGDGGCRFLANIDRLRDALNAPR